jgi:hypothetical protein
MIMAIDESVPKFANQYQYQYQYQKKYSVQYETSTSTAQVQSARGSSGRPAEYRTLRHLKVLKRFRAKVR